MRVAAAACRQQQQQHQQQHQQQQQSTHQASRAETLNSLGFAAYALDFRGFGETARDETGYTTPQRCVDDVKVAIDWINARHGRGGEPSSSEAAAVETETEKWSSRGEGLRSRSKDLTVTQINNKEKPSLLGWSQGALVAMLYAQQFGETLRDLTLFGSIFDPRTIYPRRPLYQAPLPEAPQVPNTIAAALEDFTLPGTICDEAAESFGSIALKSDPVKAPWNELHEFNACSPGMVNVPTHVIVGQQDPYVSWDAQRELFERLGTTDKIWTVLPESDHAAHILQRRHMFVRSVVGFITRADGPMEQWAVSSPPIDDGPEVDNSFSPGS